MEQTTKKFVEPNKIHLLQTDVFYVESESTDNVYYFVKFKPDVIEWCTCPDNSTKHKKCKHLFAIEFAIKWGTLRDTDKLPTDVKRDIQSVALQSKSYKDDDYSF